MSRKEIVILQNKCALKNILSDVNVISSIKQVYTMPKRPTKDSKKTSVERDFDKFRHEIYKFGLSGLDKKDQVDARVELAIKLGAKPKKWIKPIKNRGEIQNGKVGEACRNTKTNTTSST